MESQTYTCIMFWNYGNLTFIPSDEPDGTMASRVFNLDEDESEEYKAELPEYALGVGAYEMEYDENGEPKLFYLEIHSQVKFVNPQNEEEMIHPLQMVTALSDEDTNSLDLSNFVNSIMDG